jgi:hypothetical protein
VSETKSATTGGLYAALAMVQADLLDGEIVHEHPEFPLYRVTSAGRVFSIRAARFLKPIQMGAYLGLQIVHADGKLRKRYMHRLVLEAVTGPCPPGMEARHLNGKRHDNRSRNLAWGTPQQNSADKRVHGTANCGTQNPNAKLTWDQVREIRAMVRAGALQKQAVKRFGVSPMTVSRIIRGEAWTGK